MRHETSTGKQVVSKEALVFVVESHDMLREKIAGVVSRNEKVAMTAQFRECPGIIALSRGEKPDVLIIGLSLARQCEQQIARLKKEAPTVVVMFSEQEDKNLEKHVRRLGADYFVKTKEIRETVDQILEAVLSKKEELVS